MGFETLDQRRAAAGISQKDLCQAASVHPTTYSRLRRRGEGGHVATLARLKAALEEMVAARVKALRAGTEEPAE